MRRNGSRLRPAARRRGRNASVNGNTGRGSAARGRPAARLSVLAAACAALLFVGACGGDDGGDGGDGGQQTGPATAGGAAELLGPAAPAQGEPVRIGLISEGKGALADQSIELDVADATVAYLNKHRSGIAGRPIELVVCEALGDPAKTTDCANRMVEEDVVAVVVGTVAAQEAFWRPLHDAGIPLMLYGTSHPLLLADDASTFSLGDPDFPIIDLPLQVAKEEGADKVTAIVIDVPAATAAPRNVAPGVFAREGIEFELVAIPPGTADMTPQMQQVVSGDPGLVFILGTDAFCISALNGLQAVGYTGRISAIAQCITDATRTAVPADMLEGITVAATAPIETDNPSSRLYHAVIDTYGTDGIDTSRPAGMGMFTVLAALQVATESISGDVMRESVIAAIRSMPETELPGGGGLRFRCNGKAAPGAPAACVRGGLVATLNGEGRVSAYEVAGSSPIED